MDLPGPSSSPPFSPVYLIRSRSFGYVPYSSVSTRTQHVTMRGKWGSVAMVLATEHRYRRDQKPRDGGALVAEWSHCVEWGPLSGSGAWQCGAGEDVGRVGSGNRSTEMWGGAGWCIRVVVLSRGRRIAGGDAGWPSRRVRRSWFFGKFIWTIFAIPK